MKYDCSKTLDWIHEVDRVCGKYFNKGCLGCPLQSYGMASCRNATQEKIDVLQQWSDDCPEKTMQEKFFEMFPNGSRNHNGTPMCCPNALWIEATEYVCNDDCVSCWSRPYTEAQP